MRAIRKITANIPEDALARAQRITGIGITATLTEGLRALDREAARSGLRRLRGKVCFNLDFAKTRR